MVKAGFSNVEGKGGEQEQEEAGLQKRLLGQRRPPGDRGRLNLMTIEFVGSGKSVSLK